MLTPNDLLDNYGADEFSSMDVLHMQRALSRAVATVDRYIKARPMEGTRADAALNSITLTLARAYAHDEQALSDEHPLVREMREALRWLERVAAGLAFLPDEAAPTPIPLMPLLAASSTSVIADAPAFTAETFARMPA